MLDCTQEDILFQIKLRPCLSSKLTTNALSQGTKKKTFPRGDVLIRLVTERQVNKILKRFSLLRTKRNSRSLYYGSLFTVIVNRPTKHNSAPAWETRRSNDRLSASHRRNQFPALCTMHYLSLLSRTE